jgi:hypothetical protein
MGTVNRLGFYAALSTAALTLVTFVIAFLTPPLSGPFCLSGCYEYPFHDVASRFPRDYYWMYPAIVLNVTLAVLIVCIHHRTPADQKVFSTVALFFGLFACAVLIADFFVQVSVIPPSLANGETDGIALLSQFNAHGLFIVLEELGYLLLSISFLFLVPLFPGRGISRSIRYIFLAAFVFTMLAFVYYNVAFGIHREYRFEIASISISWLALIVNGVLLSIYFRR